jgi:aspartate aminotransferase
VQRDGSGRCIELTSYTQKCCKTLKIIGQWCHYQLQKMAVDAQAPEGGFYIFPRFTPHRKLLQDRGITTDVELCRRLLHDTGVALLPGSAFGRSPYELYARIAFVDFKGDLALYLIESMVRGGGRGSYAGGINGVSVPGQRRVGSD